MHTRDMSSRDEYTAIIDAEVQSAPTHQRMLTKVHFTNTFELAITHQLDTVQASLPRIIAILTTRTSEATSGGGFTRGAVQCGGQLAACGPRLDSLEGSSVVNSVVRR